MGGPEGEKLTPPRQFLPPTLSQTTAFEEFSKKVTDKKVVGIRFYGQKCLFLKTILEIYWNIKEKIKFLQLICSKVALFTQNGHIIDSKHLKRCFIEAKHEKKEKNWQNLWFFHVILKIKNCKLCVKISNSYQKVSILYLKVAYIILLHHYVVGVTINLFF